MSLEKIVIIGTGPAGTRAAETLLRQGCRNITVISEAPASGGQIYRRQPQGFGRQAQEIYGSEADKATALHRSFDALAGSVDYRPDTLVWNIFDRKVFTNGPKGVEEIPFDRLVLTTGAMDRILPIPGWTLPGVFTLGGAQIALKHQACAIGRQVVFAGAGPLLYLVAWQYMKAGANVMAVLDTSAFVNKMAASLKLLALPRLMFRGLKFRRDLKAKGVALHEGVRLTRIEGDRSVTAISFAKGGKTQWLACDAVGLGFGLNPEMQLAELAGAHTRFDHTFRQWVLAHDGEGRVAEGVYVAGDGHAIGGADVAELTGERAAWALLADLKLPVSADRQNFIRRLLKRQAIFRQGIEQSFPLPAEWLADTPDETILCRCENVTFGEVRAAITELAPNDVNRLKAFARPGMGRCQGRVCGHVLAELLASETGRPLEEVGRLRGQAPVKPLHYKAAAGKAEASIQQWLEQADKVLENG